MRNYREATCKNLLKRPLVMGVPVQGLLGLAFLTGVIQALGPFGRIKVYVSLGVVAAGYIALRLLARFANLGWEEKGYFLLEQLLAKKGARTSSPKLDPALIDVHSPDSLTEDEQLVLKNDLECILKELKPKESLSLFCHCTQAGLKIQKIIPSHQRIGKNESVHDVLGGFLEADERVFSLTSTPSHTDPKWIFFELSKLRSPFKLVINVTGIDQKRAQDQLAGARKRSSNLNNQSSVDEELTFEESSQVLEGVLRGEEQICDFSMILILPPAGPMPDERIFLQEQKLDLPLSSAFRLRGRLHRVMTLRTVTVADLIPTIFDPWEESRAILSSRRGLACYMDPEDKRLQALHWLVVGASGSGKSFFTGLMLKRLIESGSKISVLFVDHNRSFKRLVRSLGGSYLEPEDFSELESSLSGILSSLGQVQTLHGVELSELNLRDKERAFKLLLEEIEAYLRRRRSLHPVYVVLDECWQFMQKEPELVQRAFREFRKLNGAAVAITQSIGDLVQDSTGSGQAIIQNAPICVLLRQGEDLSAHKNRLGLNDTETALVRFLQQRKGEYSECLIKMPFQSKLGRLYPTPEEHALLRTDNLREDLINEQAVLHA